MRSNLLTIAMAIVLSTCAQTPAFAQAVPIGVRGSVPQCTHASLHAGTCQQAIAGYIATITNGLTGAPNRCAAGAGTGTDQVTCRFKGGIWTEYEPIAATGLTNPLVADLNAAGNDLLAVGTVSSVDSMYFQADSDNSSPGGSPDQWQFLNGGGGAAIYMTEAGYIYALGQIQTSGRGFTALGGLLSLGDNSATRGEIALFGGGAIANQYRIWGPTTGSVDLDFRLPPTAGASGSILETDGAGNTGWASASGSGSVVRASSPSLVAPNLGVPSALTLTNATGLPLAGLSGLGTGVSSWLATPSSANLSTALTNETGSGLAVFGTAPTIATPALTGAIDWNNVAVDDDDCAGQQGQGWYDSTDAQFEVCNANSGVPIAITSGGGSGDINQVGNCTSGNCFSPDGTGGTGTAIYSQSSLTIELDDDNTAANNAFTIRNSDDVAVLNLGETGALTLTDSTDGVGSSAFTANGTGTYSYTLPVDDDAADEELVTNGSGVLSWEPRTRVIASGTEVLATAAIASGACSTADTGITATGVATTDVISYTPNADITAVTGYAPVTAGGLSIYPYPTSNAVNFKICNPTASSITPGAVSLNWRVVR